MTIEAVAATLVAVSLVVAVQVMAALVAGMAGGWRV